MPLKPSRLPVKVILRLGSGNREDLSLARFRWTAHGKSNYRNEAQMKSNENAVLIVARKIPVFETNAVTLLVTTS